MLCLLTVTSSFAAAYEIFYDESLTPRQDSTINDKPLDLLGLLDRIAFVCDDDSVRNLLCYEHTHTTGLRMLGIMQMDMDIQLMLEVKYDYVKKLRRAQTDNQADSLVVFDQLAMARNHVLVNAEVIGGPNEKIVPSWTMNETDAACPYPLFGEGDVPDFYKIKISYANSKLDDSELLRLIRNSRPDRLDDRWLTKCRHVFMSALKSQAQDIPVQLMSDLLDAVVDIYEKIHIDVLFNMNRDLSSSTSSSTTVLKNEITKLSANSGLTNLQERGVQKAINYGAQIGLVHDVNLAKQNVTKLLKAVKSHLKQRSQSIRPNLSLINGSSMNEIKLNFNQSIDYPGYDWFVTSIFFLMHCDEVRAWRWLRTFSLLLPSGFLWCARLYNSPFISADMVQYTIHPIYAGTTHAVELIIENEMSQVFFAFRMSGLAPSHIAYQWIKQCFWNYLDWPEIVTYLTLCILYGIDYQVYYCVSIFKYLQNDIIKQHSARNLLPFLKCHQIRGFSARDYIDFMVSLEKRYRSILMPELKELVCFSTNNRNTN
ncbi:unnamed protein product [Didymodactylos carnosus]|uniref:BROMI C-terminal Rab TBC-like domain-containing protein n=1 Tax=Didymodactylos carnosus TaxID=1234261 RepID=A0A813RYS9_9BILA|nr:unnamed protein product [Didymodactylos carnosus]CAF3576433.1 unnamed protein product [Didymodactylos carnosus]